MTLKTLTITCCCLLFVIFFSHSPFAHSNIYKSLESARKQVVYFDLPSQSLKNGLIEFAIQSKLSVVIEAETLDGFRSKPIVGPFYPETALKLLLSKSPLTFSVYEQSQSFIIKASSITSTEIETLKDTASPKKTSVREVVVQGKHFPPLYSTISQSQVYGNRTVFSTARFINNLPKALVNDQQPDDLSDLLKLSSGITPADGFADSNDDFYVRGFPRHTLYVDGFARSNHSGNKIFIDTIERAEILKGPSTLFYGQAEPGGIVNVVRKKPSATDFSTLRFRGGDGNDKQVSLDLTGATNKNNPSLLYRLIAIKHEQDHFRDLTDIGRTLFSPSLTWKPTTRSSFTLSYEWQKSDQTREQGTVIIAPIQSGVDIVSVDGAPPSQAQPHFSSDQEILTLEHQHFFASDWDINTTIVIGNEYRKGIRAKRTSLFTSDLLLKKDDLLLDNTIIANGIIFQGTVIDKNNQWLPIALIHSLYNEQSQDETRQFKTEINGDHTLLSKHNELSMGISSDTKKLEETYVLEFRPDIQSLELSTRGNADVLEAVDATFDKNPSLGELKAKTQVLNYKDSGLFFLNTTHLSDQWQLSLGGRSTVTRGERSSQNNSVLEKLKHYRNHSKEMGLRFQASDGTALYFNYSEGFKANYQLDDLDTRISKPEASTQLELGIKALLFDDALTTTAAIFSIDKKNIVNIEFIDGLRAASTDGKLDVTGIDMDFNYQMSHNINAIGALSIIDPAIASGVYSGNMPSLSSKKIASAFLNYTHRTKASISAGIAYVGERFGSNDNNVHTRIAPYSTMDIGAALPFSVGSVNYTLQMALKNILNKDYILSTEGRIRTNHSAGRHLNATLSIQF